MRGRVHEPVAGVEHERGADHEHRVGARESCHRSIDAAARNALSKENDIRLQYSAAALARGNREFRKRRPFEVGIAIRSRPPLQLTPGGVAPQELILHFLARQKALAVHASDAIEAPV